jgi:hypothetical protein
MKICKKTLPANRKQGEPLAYCPACIGIYQAFWGKLCLLLGLKIENATE